MRYFVPAPTYLAIMNTAYPIFKFQARYQQKSNTDSMHTPALNANAIHSLLSDLPTTSCPLPHQLKESRDFEGSFFFVENHYSFEGTSDRQGNGWRVCGGCSEFEWAWSAVNSVCFEINSI